MPQVVFLMVLFGQGEVAGREDFGGDRVLQPGRHLVPGLQGQGFLPLTVIKNHGPVLPGPGRLAGMVAAPEDVQQMLVGDDRRVKIDLDGLGVVAEAVVGGVGLGPACVAYPGADNAVDSPELGIRTPESAQAEGSGLRVGGNCGIQGRDLNIRGAHGCLH